MYKDDFIAAALCNPINEIIAEELSRLALPDAWIVAGCLVQTVWNVQTARAVDHGIADYDIFYFDPDTSWQAEDAMIRKLQGQFARTGAKVEVRNQARVHLWYPEKHPRAALFDPGDRSFLDEKYPSRNPSYASRSRYLCAAWI
jgi:uncharacterized protein